MKLKPRLIDRARQCVADSKELVAKVETLLSPWPNQRYVSDLKASRLLPSDATVAQFQIHVPKLLIGDQHRRALAFGGFSFASVDLVAHAEKTSGNRYRSPRCLPPNLT